MKNERKDYRKMTIAATVIGSALVFGCAGNSTIPAAKIAGAEQTINEANKSNAVTDAAVELRNAQDHLAEAKAAMGEKEYDKATRHAESASADADLALAKASTAKSREAAAKMRETVDSLKKELDQMPGK